MNRMTLTALGLVLALAGCDQPDPDLDAGPLADSGGDRNDAGPPGDTDAGPDVDAGPPGDTDAGPPGGGCDTVAASYCTMFMGCDAERFIGAFESIAICEEVYAAACRGDADSPSPPLNDAMACAALQMASCDALLGLAGVSGGVPLPIPEACQTVPGAAALDGDCGNQTDCGLDDQDVRMHCAGSAAMLQCGEGFCVRAQEASENNSCNTNGIDRCRTFDGEHCVEGFDDQEPTGGDGRFTCKVVTFGGVGDDCLARSNRVCQAGLVCDTATMECAQALDAGQRCDPDVDLCDPLQSLTCQIDPDSNEPECKAPDYANIGQQCGTFQEGGSEVTRLCSAYSLPCGASSSTPTVCEARVRRGENCTADPDNCWPGLQCREGTCQDPVPPDTCN